MFSHPRYSPSLLSVHFKDLLAAPQCKSKSIPLARLEVQKSITLREAHPQSPRYLYYGTHPVVPIYFVQDCGPALLQAENCPPVLPLETGVLTWFDRAIFSLYRVRILPHSQSQFGRHCTCSESCTGFRRTEVFLTVMDFY